MSDEFELGEKKRAAMLKIARKLVLILEFDHEDCYVDKSMGLLIEEYDRDYPEEEEEAGEDR